MGNRQEGKKKRKGIKANVTSKFSSKRLLSRMGKQVKAGTMGPNTEFITRSSVLKKLQITLKDFRRLCILKGIYPRVPAKALKGADKVYYDIKDISYLAHEPLLKKFRDFKSFMKKIRRAAGRNEIDEARRKDDLKPDFNIDHLVKERYPRFIDALRDLDDALCMIHLFAAMPSTGRITSDHTNKCKQLSREWQYYIARSKNLHKVFVSVKGIYYQAVIMGETITWLAPHKFTQHIPKEVDIRVMMTFLEFYEVFLKFVLFKLYGTSNMKYPPETNQTLDEAGCYLYALHAKSIEGGDEDAIAPINTIGSSSAPSSVSVTSSSSKMDSLPRLNKAQQASLQAKLSQLSQEEDADDPSSLSMQPLSSALSSLHSPANDFDNDADRRLYEQAAGDSRCKLFASLKFFVNREAPLDWLQFCITSFGGVVGWDGVGSPFTIDDACITHHIIDRPLLSTHALAREYIQPQWIFDCINAAFLLPVHRYRPGSVLPPHLSPFVDDAKEGYVPAYRQDILNIAGGGGMKSAAEIAASKPSSADEDEDEEDDERKDKGRRIEELADDDIDEDAGSRVYDGKKGSKGVVLAPKLPAMTEDEEAKVLSKSMMGKKVQRLYGRMQHGINKKKETVTKLLEKRKMLEEAQEKTGKNKQKKFKSSAKSS